MITPAKILFLLFLKLRMQILLKNFLISTMDVTSIFTNIPLKETIYIVINFIFIHSTNLKIIKT